ncbi:NAD(P) transhydrogenase subunit alpha [Dinghuibacter silviterrae]|uniref:proton-translocating NAD(P)(+) transhydrogenase n=1 Tax=Dinghuibacter silviterrae TaxID=1539049 RepID=A0A4R8DE20_9BACT|nr:NAD(P) transhydrogenase subunit alpha [Dinghuibacter silviterrae]TDW95739.1 NAD(P) transhydrogenase subunit alpha [Dinghuibacter silviterrae]
MTIGVLKEPPGENRVSVLPEQVSTLAAKGAAVWVEQGAGTGAFTGDAVYEKAGATIAGRASVFNCALILGLHLPAPAEMELLASKVLVGFYRPLYEPARMYELAKAGATVFSLDMIPRTTRAQSMDILSSQASVAGYRAVLLAAAMLPRYFPMMMTAAGSVPPARVLVLGAGVAGLQAVATARRLGAVVEVFDTRPSVREEVMSLGARFVEVEGAADASGAGGYAVEQSEAFHKKQQERIAAAIAGADVVITTAQIPGKPAPILVTNAMLDGMREGSVIIDLAAATGGNTEVTKDGRTETYKGVRIVGDSSLASGMPLDASRLYGKNVLQFLALLRGKDGALTLNFEDDLVAGCCITHGGEVVHERMKALL